MDVFLMPSLFEGNPVTLIEAQASGLPCVISDVITEKIDMELGLISHLSLQDELSIWAQKLSSHHRSINGEQIKQAFKIKSYDIDSTICALTKIYKVKEI